MLITNTGKTPITMNLRDGSSYQLQPGVPTSVPDAATKLIDDSAALIALFNAGTLTVTTDAGGAFSGFPTTQDTSDAIASMMRPVFIKGGSLVGPDGSVVSMPRRFRDYVRNWQQFRDSNPVWDGTVDSSVTVTVSTADTNEFSADASVQAVLADVVDIAGGRLSSDSYSGQWRIDGSYSSLNVTGGMFRTYYHGSKCVIRIKDSAMGNRLMVNGKLVTADLIDTTAGNRYIRIVFPRNGRWLIELDTVQNGGLRGLYAEGNGRFSMPPTRPLRIVAAGDSLVGNAVNDTNTSIGGAYRGIGIWPRWIAAASGANLIQSSCPGTGYAAGGTPLTARLTELTTAYNADSYVILMGVNDAPQYGTTITQAAFEAAVRTSLSTILANDPGKPVTVMGVMRSAEFTNNAACEASIKSVVASLNTNLAKFYPLNGAGGILTGNGSQAGTTTAGTTSWIIGPDGTHITYSGNRTLAQYIGDCCADHYAAIWGQA